MRTLTSLACLLVAACGEDAAASDAGRPCTSSAQCIVACELAADATCEDPRSVCVAHASATTCQMVSSVERGGTICKRVCLGE